MLRLLMTTVTLGLFLACCYFFLTGNMDAVIAVSLFGLFTNETTKMLFPSIMVLKGVIPNASK